MNKENTPTTPNAVSVPVEASASLNANLERQTNEITSFQDQTSQEVVSVKSAQKFVPDPYPSVCMNDILSRLMKINNFQWESTDLSGTIIGSVDLPNDLFAIESVLDRLGRFRYLQADLEIQVRLNSTKFHYGQLLMYYITDTEATEVAALVKDVWNASQLPSAIIMANSCTELTIKIPYQHQYDFVDIFDRTQPAAMAHLGFVVLNPLRSSATTATDKVDVTVWARFTNITLSGPTTKKAPPPALAKVQKTFIESNVEITPQSEQSSRAIDGVTTGQPRTADFMASLRSVPVVGPAITAIGDALDLGLDKPNLTSTPCRMFTDHSYTMFQGKGVNPSHPTSLSPTAHVSDSQAIFGVDDKACRSFRHLAQTPSLYEVREIPTTATAGTLIATYPLAPLAKWSTSTGGTRYDNWFSACARQFLLWRGGKKFMFVFSCSSYTTARFRLTFDPNPGDPVDPEDPNGGDVISQIIDVKGDTVSKITVPYLSNQPYSKAPYGYYADGQSDNVGNLTLTLVNDIVDFDTANEDTTIQLSVFVAAAEDVDFAVPYSSAETDPSSVSLSEPESPEPQGDVRGAFKTEFPPIIKAKHYVAKNYVTSESVMSIRTYAHRYVNFTTFTNQTFCPASLYPPYASTPTMQPPNFWAWFRFYRGSMNFKATLTNANSSTSFQYGSSYSIDYDPVAPAFSSQDSQMSTLLSFSNTQTVFFLSVPYASTAKYIKAYSSTAITRNVVQSVPLLSSNSGFSVQYAAGDDISFGGLGTLPTITYA
jgi:hypothetical protein